MEKGDDFKIASRLMLASQSIFKIVDLIYGTIYIILMRNSGLTVIEISTVFGLSTLFLFLFEMPSGVIADIFGRKKNIIIGFLLLGISFIFLLHSSNFFSFVLATLIMQLGVAVISGSPDAWYFDLAQKYSKLEQRKKFLIKTSIIIQIFAIVGAVIGSKINFLGVNFLCYFCLVLCLIVSFLFIILSEENYGKAKEFKIHYEVWHSLYSFVKDRNMRKLIVYQWIQSFIFVAFILGWQIYALEVLSVKNDEIGMLLILFMLVMLLAKIFLQKIGMLFKETKLMFFSFVAISLAYMLIFFTNNYIGFIVGAIIFEFFWSIFITINSIWVQDLLPSESRSAYASTLSTLDAIMAFFTTLLLGFIMDRVGVNYVWFVGIIISFFGCVYIKKAFKL